MINGARFVSLCARSPTAYLHSMFRRPRALQIRAFLLLAVFLSAGTSLPGLDALFHHSLGADIGTQSHVEVAGGCVDHAGHCSLGRSASGSNAVAAVAGPVESEPLHQAAQVLPADPPRADARYVTAARPRAPPAPVV